MSLDPELVRRAADAIRGAGALLVTAGAGMGVDSGLPDFRGDEGFWNAYPPYRHLGLSFVDLANPEWFRRDPAVAWGFYGHRRNLYRRTRPHRGFELLRAWGEAAPGGAFVFTSNVDGQFQRAGFPAERVVECHGAIDWSQCLAGCGAGIFPADPGEVAIDERSMRAADPLPACPRCGGLARPNILMFGDWGWEGEREEEQGRRLRAWQAENVSRPLAVIELGAGSAIPTVRRTSEVVARNHPGGGTLIRINPRESQAPAGAIGLPAGALAGLEAIEAALR